MFKGKVSIIKNINGKEERVEKEFNSPEEYREFLASNQINIPEPKLTLSEWSSLGDYIDKIFTEKLGSFFLEGPEFEAESDLPIDMSKYEKEAAKIEEEKEKLKTKKEELKRAISRLKEFIKTFEKEGKKDLAKRAKEDVKKLERELADIK
jgi:hypothetical protein